MRLMQYMLLLIFSAIFPVLVFGNTPPPPDATPPQVAPNIVISPSAEDQTKVNQLFDKDAAYQHFHRYAKLKLFPIPTREQSHEESETHDH